MAEYIKREDALDCARVSLVTSDDRAMSVLLWLVRKRLLRLPAVEAEPVRHGRWIDRYGGKYANHLYECSECKETALYKVEVDVLGKENIVQALSAACPHCRAKMDLEG